MPIDKPLEDIVAEIRRNIKSLRQLGRTDLIMQAIDATTLEELRIEAAKQQLSKLVITANYRFLLPSYDIEIDISPLHKAVYLLFLNHPEGIEFKRLGDYKDEMRLWYRKTAKIMDEAKIDESIARLTDPLDNAINEKCSRIKKAFLSVMDDYSASYYIISGHTEQHIPSTGKIWYRRLKVIKLPRHLVIYENH